MPFQSEAQRRKFEELVKSGQMKQSVLDEWNHATGDRKLPERVSTDESVKDEPKWKQNQRRLNERNKSRK